jgi:hypothetical protein
MKRSIKLPSGKTLDLDRFIALVTTKENKVNIILEGEKEAIEIEQQDFDAVEKVFLVTRVQYEDLVHLNSSKAKYDVWN